MNYKPDILNQKGFITAAPIPAMQFDEDFSASAKKVKNGELIEIYRRMYAIRRFEEALLEVTRSGKTHGIAVKLDYGDRNNPACKYMGTLHTCIGQEAVSVGEAYSSTDFNDKFFGSHRSHGELIAVPLTEIYRKSVSSVSKTLKTSPYFANFYRQFKNSLIFDDKNVLKNTVVRKFRGIEYTLSKKELAEISLYGSAFAECLNSRLGLQNGKAGSMHAYCKDYKIFPGNAIVGAQAGIATGAALYKRAQNETGVVICNLGDAALGAGVVYESMNFAASDQFKELWHKDTASAETADTGTQTVQDGRTLPVIYAIVNNGYGVSGRTQGETMAFREPCRIGMGVSPTNLYAERINGNNVFAVIDAFTRKRETAESKGACLLDLVTYRYEGHSLSDKKEYRSTEEIEAWKTVDPLITFKTDAIASGVLSEEDFIKA
ncbi:MAG: hypothetical protein LBN25_03815, partial [Christensenellaceae bacterium]|nr:hypothetical protein [Christensenellaceae bacterium]